MQKYILILMSVSLLGMQACKEVDTPDPDPTPAKTIVGVWDFDGMELKNGSMSSQGVPIATYNSQSSNETGTVEFTEGGKMISNFGYTNTMNITIFGQTQTQTEEVPAERDEESYEFNSTTNALTVGEGEDMIVFIVSGLGTDQLTLKSDIDFTEEVDGQLLSNTADLEMRLSK